MTVTATYFITNHIHYNEQIWKRAFISDIGAASETGIFKHCIFFRKVTCVSVLFSFFPFKPQKKEDQQSEAKASPKKSSEPTIDLLGLGKKYIITCFSIKHRYLILHFNKYTFIFSVLADS